MTPCLAAGCWLMFFYNSITCLVHSVKYLFTFPFSCPGEVFLSPQGFLVCSLKKAKQHYLLVFLFLRFARRKDKNEGHLFWNWNFTHITKSDPINNILQLTQLTLKLTFYDNIENYVTSYDPKRHLPSYPYMPYAIHYV